MIIRKGKGRQPEIAPSARGADNAVVAGDVTLGAYVTLWYGAVLRGDETPIRIGEGSNIQDNCVVHGTAGQPVTVGSNVVVGHGAILHSCTVEDGREASLSSPPARDTSLAASGPPSMAHMLGHDSSTIPWM